MMMLEACSNGRENELISTGGCVGEADLASAYVAVAGGLSAVSAPAEVEELE